jgi:PAS domain S-box-containing protein
MPDGPDPETLLNLTQDKVVVLEADGSFRSLNAATVEVIGFEPDELVGANAFSLVYPDDEARIREQFEAIVAGETQPAGPIEYRYATADGGWVWLRTRVHTPESTGIDGYVLTSRDVTREVESRRRLETIASVSTDVFWMFSADWSELLFINDAVERMFDVSPDRLERDPRLFLESIHPDDRPFVERAMAQLSAGESIEIDYRVGNADEATRWIRVPGEPVVEDGEVVAVTGFARDVTDEYRRNRQLAVMDNLLRHTIRNHMNIVDGTAEQIADRVAATKAFDPAAWTTDDTPTAEMTADDEATVADDSTPPCTPTELAELGADLVEYAETIRRVASDLLTTAEKQRGVIDLLRQRGSSRSVAIAPVIEEAIDMVVNENGGHDAIDVRYGDPTTVTSAGNSFVGDSPADESVPIISVSYPRDVQVFTHSEIDYAIAELVENAVEHATSTPYVQLEVTETDGRVEISVRDNCPPIPAEERNIISDRWEMDDLRHTGGMGLWLVYWVANRSGGSLTFDTHSDGNVVTFAVPNAGRDAELTAANPSTRPRTVATRASGGDDEGIDPEIGDDAETRDGAEIWEEPEIQDDAQTRDDAGTKTETGTD